jgi:hypothetical protein
MIAEARDWTFQKPPVFKPLARTTKYAAFQSLLEHFFFQPKRKGTQKCGGKCATSFARKISKLLYKQLPTIQHHAVYK